MKQTFEVPAQEGGKKYYEDKGYPEVYVETKMTDQDKDGYSFKVDVISIERDTQLEINDILQALGFYGEACKYTEDLTKVEIGPFTKTRLRCMDITEEIVVKEGTREICSPNVDPRRVEILDLPSTLTEIGPWCCYNLGSLTTVRFHNNQTINIRENAFCLNTGLKEIIGLDPKYINCIEEGAFAGCASLTVVPIPNNHTVTTIPKRYAAETACKIITIPTYIKHVEYYAFGSCHHLEAVYIMEGCERVERQAFSHCESLTIVKIPDSVKKIYEDTFEGCGMFTVVCNPGSYAEYWANMMKIHVEHSGTL